MALLAIGCVSSRPVHWTAAACFLGSLRPVRPDRPDVLSLFQRAIDRLGLSARAYHRLLKAARTIADLEGSDPVISLHAAEAIQYRALDRTPSVAAR